LEQAHTLLTALGVADKTDHEESYYRKEKQNGPAVCEVRSTSGENYMARRVIILTDKPQKPLPAAVWEKYVAPVAKIGTAPAPVIECSACGIHSPRNQWAKSSNALWTAAIECPRCYMNHADTNEAKTAPCIGEIA